MAERFQVVILEEAAIDIEDIRDFNEAKRKGLGFDYLEDILDCIERIQTNPKEFQYYQTSDLGIRRGLSKRFAVIILYDIDFKKERVEILAIADSRQDWDKLS